VDGFVEGVGRAGWQCFYGYVRGVRWIEGCGCERPIDAS